MWVWHHEMLTSPPEVLENGVPLMVQSPHLQQLLCVVACVGTILRHGHKEEKKKKRGRRTKQHKHEI